MEGRPGARNGAGPGAGWRAVVSARGEESPREICKERAMCRLCAVTSETPLSPMVAMNALEAMREGHDGSGVGLYLTDLGGPFEEMKGAPILSGIFSTEGLKRLDRFMMDRGFMTKFKVSYRGYDLGEIHLNLAGTHNVVNALAACGVAIELDIPFPTIQEGLKSFSGIHRRLEVKYDGDIKLIDDYGHHPTEIKATLSAMRKMWEGRIIVAFQPHRYTRTRGLMDDFASSFNEADVLIVTEIYAASEDPIEGISGSSLAEKIRASGHKNVIFAPTRDDVIKRILENAKPGDFVVTLGAGDLYKIDDKLRKAWTGKK